MQVRIEAADPRDPSITAMISDQKQEALDRLADAPDFTLDADALAGEDIRFWIATLDGALAGMIALKRLGAGSGEVKSMRTQPEFRGRGIGRQLLQHLMSQARREGLAELLLETGVGPGYASARWLYEMAGFVPCPPFADYPDVETSVYMRLDLRAD